MKHTEEIALLRDLIATPSFSCREEGTAALWQEWLGERGAAAERLHNNVYAVAPGYSSSRPTLLLNSHHDTVWPSESYSRNPFAPDVEGDRLYGLGSNDAAASGVALASAFLRLMHTPGLPVNLILAITAAEEVMGEYGMRAFLPHLASRGLYPQMALVGEPTGMQPAVGERGLVVLDGVTTGVSGHAARREGENAIYRAMEDINRLRNFVPERQSSLLGPLKVSVTMINAGTQHNVVPDRCTFVVDVRTTDAYSNADTACMLQQQMRWSTLTPRSTRVQASAISPDHPLVQSAVALGRVPFVSPTTSDMALMHDIPSLKMGPGESERSHKADEYVLLSELDEAIDMYPALITNLKTE